MDATGREAAYGEAGISLVYLWVGAGIALLALMVTALIAYKHLTEPTSASWQHALQGAWLSWLIVPPLWFFFEYQFLFKHYGPDGAFESFKYGQDVASKIWLGIAAALTVLVAK